LGIRGVQTFLELSDGVGMEFHCKTQRAILKRTMPPTAARSLICTDDGESGDSARTLKSSQPWNRTLTTTHFSTTVICTDSPT
jgi:hypothetical protein